MNYRFFIWGMRIIVLFSLILVGFSLFSLNPYLDEDSLQGINLLSVAILKTSLFFLFFGLFSLFLYRIRKFKLVDPKTRELNDVVGISVRQGFLLALIPLILLIMQSFRVLVWWDGLLAVGAVILLELYFLIRR